MKKFTLFAACLMLVGLMILPAFATEGEQADLSTLVIEQDGAKLTLDPESFQISFQPADSEKVYPTLATSSPSGSRVMRNLQQSALSVQFIANALSGTTGSMDSYSMSVDLGEASFEPLPKGFRVTYTIGSNELTVDDLPKMIPVATYNERLQPHWDERNDKLFKSNYRVVPREDGNSLFVRIKDDLGKLAITQLYELIFNVGDYTVEDRDNDNAAYGHVVEFINPKITVVMDYLIDKGDLIVSVPLSELTFTKDNEVTALDVLPYFLSADKAQQGYLFVPDGPGALIHFNNNRMGIAAYSTPVFGRDVLIRADEYRLPTPPTNLPVYGIKTNEGAVLAIIEEGAELATITADISGHSDDYNRVFSTFTLRDVERVAMGGNKTVTTPRYASDVYEGSLRLRYRFLNGADAGYVQMAKEYRQYLMDAKVLTEAEQDSTAPLFVELVGAVKKQKFFLGIPYDATVQATTIQQAAQIYDELRQAGISNIKLLYSGLFSGGVKHGALYKARLDGGLGKASDLTALAKRLQDDGNTLYPAINLGRVYSPKGFSMMNNAARQHDGSIAQVFEPFQPQLNAKPYKGSAYIAPNHLQDYVSKVINNMNGLQLNGVFVQDLGNTLVGTYKRNAHISPIHAVPMVQQALSAIAPLNTMMDSPNAYALPYTHAITNLSTLSSGHKLLDATVPFAQMVYDGSLPYSSPSWNLNPQIPLSRHLLSAIESKTAPRFTLSFAQPTIFHNTGDLDFLGYFATWYKDALPQVVEAYAAYQAFYEQVTGARIIDHQIITKDTRQVRYDNGVQVLLNYGEDEALINGAAVPGGGYLIKGGP